MNNIPKKLREKLSKSKFMEMCIFHYKDPNHQCGGRVEWEHVWQYANRQIQEEFSIMPVCSDWHRGNFGTTKEKDWHKFVSLLVATDDELARYPRKDWRQEWLALCVKYSANHSDAASQMLRTGSVR